MSFSSHQITRSTPAGCFVSVFALFPMFISALGWYGLYRWWWLPVEERAFDQRFWILATASVMGALIALGLLWLAKKLITSADFRKYDPGDPDESSLKF